MSRSATKPSIRGFWASSSRSLMPASSRKRAVGGLLVGAVPVDEVGVDLRRGEVLDREDPLVRDQRHVPAERGEHLLVGPEVLGAGGHDDLGPAPRGLEQVLQVVGGPVVAEPGDELVEPVEEQDDPALLEHVAERPQVDPVLAVVGQVGGHQPVDRVRTVHRARGRSGSGSSRSRSRRACAPPRAARTTCPGRSRPARGRTGPRLPRGCPSARRRGPRGRRGRRRAGPGSAAARRGAVGSRGRRAGVRSGRRRSRRGRACPGTR